MAAEMRQRSIAADLKSEAKTKRAQSILIYGEQCATGVRKTVAATKNSSERARALDAVAATANTQALRVRPRRPVQNSDGRELRLDRLVRHARRVGAFGD